WSTTTTTETTTKQRNFVPCCPLSLVVGQGTGDDDLDSTLVDHCSTTRGRHLTCTVRDPSALARSGISWSAPKAIGDTIVLHIIDGIHDRSIFTWETTWLIF
ncbi:hypothetical protein PV326_013439, partial [Microctonus aethiopoides]